MMANEYYTKEEKGCIDEICYTEMVKCARCNDVAPVAEMQTADDGMQYCEKHLNGCVVERS